MSWGSWSSPLPDLDLHFFVLLPILIILPSLPSDPTKHPVIIINRHTPETPPKRLQKRHKLRMQLRKQILIPHQLRQTLLRAPAP